MSLTRRGGGMSRKAIDYFGLSDLPELESPPLTPCQRLALAVLADALHVLYTTRLLGLRPAHPNAARPWRLRQDAIEWFQSDDMSHPFTFVSLCEALPTLDPLAIRAELAAGNWTGSPHTHHTHFMTFGNPTGVVQKRPQRLKHRA